MGGFGSGRSRTRTCGSVETSRELDISKLNRLGALREGWSGNYHWSSNGQELARIGLRMDGSSLHLNYQYRCSGGKWEPVGERVPIDWRECRFGGRRPYFRCQGIVNGQACCRTVLRLYGAGKYFVCRHCYRLSHGSQHEDLWDRAMRKANKARIKLGGEPGTCSPIPQRPKGLRHRTYDRALQTIFNAEDIAEERLLLMLARLQHLDKGSSRRARRTKKGAYWR